ncbi:MAG: hypothetical protein EBR34_01060 [Sphingomonadaceae bacterium]|nr:hypothetical protein [Sphingomonadaceae bacterium]
MAALVFQRQQDGVTHRGLNQHQSHIYRGTVGATPRITGQKFHDFRQYMAVGSRPASNLLWQERLKNRLYANFTL